MDYTQLEAARGLFENHLSTPSAGLNVFFGDCVGKELDELASEMLNTPEKVNTYLNWYNCELALASVGVQILQDSFFAFACPEEALEGVGEEEFEDLDPEDVKALLEYFAMPKVGSYKLEEWL